MWAEQETWSIEISVPFSKCAGSIFEQFGMLEAPGF